MNLGSIQSADASIQTLTSVDDKRLKLQAALFRKTVDSQEQQSAELVRMMEGKGRHLDIRV